MQRTLIILPGWGGNSETWKQFISLAEKHFRVLCVNLPCFGDEPCPDDVWGTGEYADFVYKKIIETGISDLIVLGHSFGGQIAVRLVSEHPELFSHLVLVGAAVIRPKRPLRRLLFWLVAKTGKLLFRLPIVEQGSAFAKKVLYRLAASPDYLETSRIKRDIFRKVIREDGQKFLGQITVPTTVIWGARDRYTPLRYGKKIAGRIPGATLDIVPDGKHGLHLQMPETLLQKIVACTRRR